VFKLGIVTVLCVSTAFTQPPRTRDLKVEPTNTPAPAVGALPPSELRWALIVGVDQYADKQITPLAGAAADAHALGDALVKYAGFQPEHVVVLATDLPSERQPTKGNILVKLSNISSLLPKDGLLLFSFAGHGIERGGDAYLLPSDAKVSNDIRVVQETAVGATHIKSWIGEMGIKQVLLLLDACRNDPTAGRSDAPNLMTESYRKAFTFDLRNHDVEAFATLYATKVGGRAYLYSEKGHGYFTWALLEGIAGKAANAAGEVTLGSLQRYVQDTVPRLVQLDLGVDQRPFAEVGGYRAEELVIANAAPLLAAGSGTPELKDSRRLEMEEWERISGSRDLQAFVKFREKNPAGSLSVEAGRRIEQLTWESVKETADPKVLQDFLTQFPQGAHAQQAGAALEALQQVLADRQSIATVVARYAESFGRKDLDQIRTLWPTLGSKDSRKMQDFFGIARSIQLKLELVAPPEITGDHAQVQCTRSLRFADERGQQQPAQNKVTIRFRRMADAWVIESLQ